MFITCSLHFYLVILCTICVQYVYINSPKPWRVLIPSFRIEWKLFHLPLLPNFLFSPLYLDKTSPKNFPNLSAWLSLFFLKIPVKDTYCAQDSYVTYLAHESIYVILYCIYYIGSTYYADHHGDETLLSTSGV